MNTLTLDTNPTLTSAPIATADDRWDATIANALNFHFSSNAQDAMHRNQRPYYPMMPLPTDRPVKDCRDNDEYLWNKLVLRYEQAFVTNKYDLCYQLRDEMETLERTISSNANGTRLHQYITGYHQAAHALKDVHWNATYELGKVAPQPITHWAKTEQQPIQWRSK